MNELCDTVAALEQALCRRLGEPRFNLWFAEKTRLTWDNEQLTIGVPNHFVQEWLQKAFAEDLHAAGRQVLGRPLALRFSIDPQLFRAARLRETGAPEAAELQSGAHQSGATHDADVPAVPAADTLPASRARGPVRDDPVRDDQGSEEDDQGDQPAPTLPSAVKSWRHGATGQGRPGVGLAGLGLREGADRSRGAPPRARRWHRLEDFVVGPCNRVAHAAALSVVEAPGQDANPLVVHGPVGTGKTHLLEGVALGVRRSRADWRVCFTTAEDFTHRFVQAMRQSKLGAFRKQYRECDVLILDDLHFLASKPATQEEFLHTLDALVAEGRQVVVSCDCHPRLADQFVPELTDRLLGGAIWALAPPEVETRRALLRAKIGRGGGLFADDDVIALLADNLRGNVRELEGALNSLQHFSKVMNRGIDLPLARQVLADLLRHSVRVVRLADVELAVCQALRLENGALQSKERGWRHSHPRMLAMYLARKHSAATYTEIGQRFGNRNHSTAVAAEKKVRGWLQLDGAIQLGERTLRVRDLVDRIERELLR